MAQAIYRRKGLRLTVNYNTADAFKESDHPRADDGKFGNGPGHASTAGLQKVGEKLGSNPGGQYEDAKGVKHYVKHVKSAHHAANEVLAGHLYVSAGVPITNSHRIDHEGQSSVISKWAKHEGKFDPKNAEHVNEVREHFAAHAWLANWDAIGLENDNQVLVGGLMHLVDAGGSMQFRAQGGAKEFGPKVAELETMRDPGKGKQAAAVFGGMTPEEIHASAQAIAAIPDAAIRMQVQKHGHGDAAQKKALADVLIARKNHILETTAPKG